MLVNPWTPALLQPQLLVEIVRGLAGQRGGPAWQKQCWSWGCRSWSFTAHPPALHATPDGAQARLLWAGNLGRWGGGTAGRWPLAFPPAGCSHSRDEDQKGQPWVWGHRGSFGETQKQGCRMPPTVPSSQTQHVWAQFGCRGSRGPGMDREKYTVLVPQEGTWVGSSCPALSLFHPFSPFHHPSPGNHRLPSDQAEQGARQDREGDQPGIE